MYCNWGAKKIPTYDSHSVGGETFKVGYDDVKHEAFYHEKTCHADLSRMKTSFNKKQKTQ